MSADTHVYERNRTLLYLALLLLGLGTAVVIGNPAFHWLRTLIVAGLLVLGTLLLWAFFGNRYELTASELDVRFWPYEKRIPLADIQSAEAISWLWELLGDVGRILRTSALEVLQIRYRLADGRIKSVWGFVPKNGEQFLDDLAKAANLRDERS